MKNKHSFKEKIQYWIDNGISKSAFFILKLLGISILFIVAIISLIITILHISRYGNFILTLWDTLADVINADFPKVDDAIVNNLSDNSWFLMYRSLPFNAIIAITGLVFTGTVIAVINNIFMQKINALKDGTSFIIEHNHIIIFGYAEGEHTLLEQLILSQDNKQRTILICSDSPKSQMENDIKSSVNIPKNIKILCRTIDTTDPNVIKNLSIENAKAVIINTFDDDKNLRTLLAVNLLCNKNGNTDLRVVVAMKNNDYLLTEDDLHLNNLIMLQTNDTIARVIAHTCVTSGLSSAFTEIMSINKTKFYVNNIPEMSNQTFSTLTNSLENAIPIGIYNNGITKLNLNKEYVISEQDEIIYLSDKQVFNAPVSLTDDKYIVRDIPSTVNKEVYVIFGYNNAFNTVISEISIKSKSIIVTGITDEEEKLIERDIDVEKHGILTFTNDDIISNVRLEQLVKKASHVIILSDNKDPNKSDSHTMLLIFKMRSIKRRLGLNFSITAEIIKEKNIDLISSNDTTDFVIASKISSMIIVQMVTTSKLKDTLSELLSIEGCELKVQEALNYVKENKSYSIAELRQIALKNNSILVGYIKDNNGYRNMAINPNINKITSFKQNDSLILITNNVL